MADAAEQQRDKSGSSLDDNLREWFSGLGQGLGNLARSVVNGFDSLWNALDDEVELHPSREPAESLDEILGKLSKLLADPGKQGYDPLAQGGELERLLSRALRAVRRARFRKRLEAARAARVAPVEAAPVVDAPPAAEPTKPPAAAPTEPPATAAPAAEPPAAKAKKKKSRKPDDEVELPDGILEEFDSGDSEE
jgi:hypothetical protein